MGHGFHPHPWNVDFFNLSFSETRACRIPEQDPAHVVTIVVAARIRSYEFIQTQKVIFFFFQTNFVRTPRLFTSTII